MEEQQPIAQEEARSPVAKLLLAKVISHRFFSESVLYYILLFVAFILPIAFIPGGIATPEFTKIFILEVGLLLGTLIWAVGRLRDGVVEVPKSALLGVFALLVVQFVVASAFSPVAMVSFFGTGYDVGAASSFVVLFLLLFLSSIIFTTRDRILMLYAATLLSGSVMMLYHALRHFFGADFLDFGTFTAAVATPVGKWNDFASLVGGVMLLVLLTLYFFPQNRTIRIPAGILFFAGLFFLLVIDFTILWYILFVMTGLLVAFAVYEGELSHRAMKRETEAAGGSHPHTPFHKRAVHHLPWLATALLAISFVYGVGQISTIPWGSNDTTIATFVSRTLNAAPYSEVVLTPNFTYDIVWGSIKDAPLFGTGPNRFGNAYLKYKTSDMNLTAFWDTTFDSGMGRIPTFFGTTGATGAVLWLLFLVFLFMKTRKIFALREKDRISAYLGFSLFILTLYFWSLAFFYLPGVALFAPAFIFTGALIAHLVGEGILSRYSIRFEGGHRLSAIMTPLVVIVIVGVISSGLLLYRQVSSLVAFRDAQLALAANDLVTAEASMSRASTLSERDLYHRALSNIALLKLQQLSQNAGSLDQAEAISRANQLVADARTHGERAVSLDPTNFENYLQLGGVFDSLGTLGVQNTTDLARANYTKALELNPKSPRVLFVLSRLELNAGNREAAKNFLRQALAERPNFLEAISFLVQLELQDGNSANAMNIMRSGLAVEPTNFLLRFALGYLYYGAKEYPAAIAEFEAAVMLNPVYADAKYFLGLAYAKNGQKEAAVQQFTDVETLNPNNAEVKAILKNLRDGRDPFYQVPAPSQDISDVLGDIQGTP